MSKNKPVSFRLPSKYVVFLDALAADWESDRTAVLVQMLDRYLAHYLAQQSSSQSLSPESTRFGRG
jgi:predicted transcriptional regulator